jgi:lysosomal acid phosphatase
MVSLVCGELVQLVTMFRHGARYHINSFYDGNETIPNWGKLTSVGMRQHYTLGSMVRDLYSTQLKFLRPNFNHSEVEVYSTDVDRTINSAQSHLFGMFPNNTGPKIPEGLSETLMVPPYSYNDTINSDYALPNGHDMIPIRLNGFIYICDNLTKEVNKNVADEHATID